MTVSVILPCYDQAITLKKEVSTCSAYSIPPTSGQPNQVNPDYTHIAVILDRTGSMESIRDDTIGGFNAFLNEQKQQPSKATLTLVQFDSQDPYEVIHQVKTIKEVPELTKETYVPRATTPLLDAIGRGINDLEKCVADMKEDDRPSKVVFVVITDGQENASREFRRDQILKMINEKEKQYGWQFVFLSADLDAINDAMDHGFQAKAAMAFDQTGVGVKNAWALCFPEHLRIIGHRRQRMWHFRMRTGINSGVSAKERGRFFGYAVLRWWGTAYLKSLQDHKFAASCDFFMDAIGGIMRFFSKGFWAI